MSKVIALPGGVAGLIPDVIVLRARVATTANITLSGVQTLDGQAGANGYAVLAKNQSSPAENGLYVMQAGAWQRQHDMPVGMSVAGVEVNVQSGTVASGLKYACTSAPDSDVVGSDSLTFSLGGSEDATLVHRAGAETITGVKTFASGADPSFAKEADHTIRVAASTTSNTDGGNLFVKAADGAATNANGGGLILDAGAKAGSGTDGTCALGATNAELVMLGRSGKSISMYGASGSVQCTNVPEISVTASLTGMDTVDNAALLSALNDLQNKLNTLTAFLRARGDVAAA